ncbi:MAG: DUF3090 family protein [Chloroflexi bacterium]|nr:DUF3090 family protein [Chloroflexota bacterium]
MIDFGLVDAVDAEAIGQPGERTFRVRARSGDSYAALWLEKEQLAQLGRLFSQLIADRSQRRGQAPRPVEDVGNFPLEPEVDLHVARLGLDYDTEQDHVVLLADDQSALERGASPAFRMEISRDQALNAMKLIEAAAEGGRPLCPLCHQALEYEGQAHFCPGGNGHSKELELPAADLADDADPEDDDN